MSPKRLLLIAAAITGGALLLYRPGFTRWIELKAHMEQLRVQVEALRRENQRLTEEARRLREDPAYAEAVARQEMGFVRPGETVVKIKKR